MQILIRYFMREKPMKRILKPAFYSYITKPILVAVWLLSYMNILNASNTDANRTSQSKRPTVTIGIIQISSHPALDETFKGIEFTLKEALESSVQIISKNAQGSVLNATMAAKKFVGQKVDLIITIGTPAAQAAASAVKGTSIPVVFSSISDPVDAGLVKTVKTPGGQITGVSNATPQKPQLEFFQTFIPNLKTIGMIYNPGESNSISLVKETTKAAKELDLTIQTSGVTKSHEVALATRKLISSGAQAIFINNDNTALSAFDVITQIAGNSGIPVFVSDTDYVKTDEDESRKYGALAALGPNQFNIGNQTAEMALLILDGKDPKTYAVRFPDQLSQVVDPIIKAKLGM